MAGVTVEENNLQVQISTLRKALDRGGTAEASCHRAGSRVSPRRLLRHAAANPALPDKPSIAVLPFPNLSGDPEQDYFADGMVEDIITALVTCAGCS